jgi:hypothetical protein
MLHAFVPRNLRVRSSVQVAGQRLPATGFLLVAGTVFLGGLAVVFGAELERTIWGVAIAALIGLVVVEGRLYGRSSREVARLIARHYQRTGTLRRTPTTIVLRLELTNSQPARLPRWMDEVVR